jgi:hypothetical protein
VPLGTPSPAIGADAGVINWEKYRMSQNLASWNLTDAQLTAVDAALTELETQLAGLIALPNKKLYKKMGNKSEAFCRQTLHVLEQNPQMVPPNLGLADAVSDLNGIEQLRPRMVRLARLSERAADTSFALGSDVMAAALEGYNLLKRSGKSEGLDSLRKELGLRFAKASRQVPPAPAPAPAPAESQVLPFAKAA